MNVRIMRRSIATITARHVYEIEEPVEPNYEPWLVGSVLRSRCIKADEPRLVYQPAANLKLWAEGCSIPKLSTFYDLSGNTVIIIHRHHTTTMAYGK